MPRLTDVAIRNTKPGEKPVKLWDSGGLYLIINPRFGKWWRWDFTRAGKRRTLSMGTYPDVSLKQAREKRDDARRQLAAGIDPGAVRRAAKAAAADTFGSIAREWHDKHAPRWGLGHAGNTIRCLERDVFPWLGNRPVRDVTAPELLGVLRRIEARGALETAHRVLSTCGRVFRYAVATGRADRDTAADLRGAIPPGVEKHHATITDPAAIGALLQAIDGYQGTFVTQCALRLAPLVFVRPGELRGVEWSEIDLDGAEWRIPAKRMKAGILHIVPLSCQAVEVLREIHPLTGSGRYVFPSLRTTARSISETTMNAALRRMGYAKDEMTGHGFLSMASTLLNEQGWNHDAIERQLAHGDRNAVRAAYNYAEHLPERRRMMAAWAEYLEGLKNGKAETPNDGCPLE